MNPCPCGYLGDGGHACSCTPDQVQRYRARLSGPLLDRFDLCVDVRRHASHGLEARETPAGPRETSADVAQRVLEARQRQISRQGKRNADLAPVELEDKLALTAPARALAAQAARRFDWSMRALHRTLKVARTIADLAQRQAIDGDDVAEAVGLRRQLEPLAPSPAGAGRPERRLTLNARAGPGSTIARPWNCQRTDADDALPLAGLRVVELHAIGPVPFAGMVLRQLGADVTRVSPPQDPGLGIGIPDRFDLLNRHKAAVALDLKNPAGRDALASLLEPADVLLEGFRPGVLERLGLAPQALLKAHPRLVIGRLSGWGDRGPLAARAGHDINYLALTGVLAAIGNPGQPMPPLNLVADFGGGAMHLLVGVLARLVRRGLDGNDGRGGIVTTSIAAGTVGLTPMFYGMLGSGPMAAAARSEPARRRRPLLPDVCLPRRRLRRGGRARAEVLPRTAGGDRTGEPTGSRRPVPRGFLAGNGSKP